MGMTFEEQQAARNEYQAKVRVSKLGSSVSQIEETEEEEIVEAEDPAVVEEESDVEPVEADASSKETDSEPAEVSEKESDDKPSPSDNKAAWVAYAAKVSGESEETINERHTKTELVEKFG